MRRLKYRATFTLVVVAAIAIGVLALSSIRELVTVITRMRTDQQMRVVLHEVLVSVHDMQASAREPLDVPAERERVRRAAAAIEAQLEFLSDRAGDESADAVAVGHIAGTAAELLVVARGSDATTARQRLELAATLQREVGALIRFHDAGLAAEEARVAKIVERTTWAVGAGGSVLVVMIIVSGLMQARQIRERSAARNAMAATNEELRARMEELGQRAREIEILSEMGELLQVSSSQDEMREVVTVFGRLLFPDHDGALYTMRSSRDLSESIAAWGSGPAVTFSTAECWALRRGRAHGRRMDSGMGCTHGAFESRSTLCIPMSAQGETTGVFCLVAPAGSELDPQAANLAKAVADQVALSLANLRLQESLRTRAIRDPLTNLFNRRYLEESLERELNRALRNRGTVGVLMIDVDHFKQYNDTYGHAGGDAYLQQLARVMQSAFRAEDIVCRFGGEEFAVILPDARQADVYERAEQLRASVAELQVRCDGLLLGRTTVSIGLAIAPDDGDSCRKVLASADHALYEAKRSGRDRVVEATPPPRLRGSKVPALVAVGLS